MIGVLVKTQLELFLDQIEKCRAEFVQVFFSVFNTLPRVLTEGLTRRNLPSWCPSTRDYPPRKEGTLSWWVFGRVKQTTTHHHQAIAAPMVNYCFSGRKWEGTSATVEWAWRVAAVGRHSSARTAPANRACPAWGRSRATEMDAAGVLLVGLTGSAEARSHPLEALRRAKPPKSCCHAVA